MHDDERNRKKKQQQQQHVSGKRGLKHVDWYYVSLQNNTPNKQKKKNDGEDHKHQTGGTQ